MKDGRRLPRNAHQLNFKVPLPCLCKIHVLGVYKEYWQPLTRFQALGPGGMEGELRRHHQRRAVSAAAPAPSAPSCSACIKGNINHESWRRLYKRMYIYILYYSMYNMYLHTYVYTHTHTHSCTQMSVYYMHACIHVTTLPKRYLAASSPSGSPVRKTSSWRKARSGTPSPAARSWPRPRRRQGRFQSWWSALALVEYSVA